MSAAKHEVRAAARSARARLTAEARGAAAQAAALRALELPPVARATSVLAYAATSEELDPSPLVAALRERGARVAYPRVTGPGALALHWCADADLAPGYCGILEPDPREDPAALADFDLVLVPGTAYDAACGRLGMGGGFYDRLLARLDSRVVSLGLAFDEQIVDEVPLEAHDIPLSAVVTPTRTLTRA